MDYIDQLVRYYNSNEADKQREIVGFVLEHLTELPRATIYDVADWAYTSASSVSRMTKAIGFENFSDFKTKVSLSLKEYRYLNRNFLEIETDENLLGVYVRQLQKALAELTEAIDYTEIRDIVDLLDRCSVFYFYTIEEFDLRTIQKDLLMLGKKVVFVKTPGGQQEHLKTIKKGDVVFTVIPDLKEMAYMKKVLKKLKEKGIITVVLCSSSKNSYRDYADYMLTFEGSKTSFDGYLFTVLVNLIALEFKFRYVDKKLEQML